MTTAIELIQQGQRDEIWKKYCGFTELSLKEFMEIQNRLLMEQIGLLKGCDLGARLMDGKTPVGADEFRDSVPLTTYADYVDDLGAKNEDVLPLRPRWWLRTSGRTGGKDGYKWAPYTPAMAKKLGETILALFMLAATNRPGEFPFEEGDRMLFTMAPFPYMSGGVARAVLEEFPFRYLPPLEEAEEMEFQERIENGFASALDEGMEAMNAIGIVLVRIGERFTEGTGTIDLRSLLMRPRTLVRLAGGYIKARAAGRKHLLPRDLWTVKGIATGGTDTGVFREQIEEMWGRKPVEAYGCTEVGVFCLQLWDGPGMTFLPDIGFLEFLPIDDHRRNLNDPSYVPRTLLLDQVTVGGIYEMVVTSFHGGIYTRYRTGDFVRIISMDNRALGVNLPQMVFHAKSVDIIDLASFARLTEREIWTAIENAGVKYVDWTARKEYADDKPVLTIYIETRGDNGSTVEIKDRVHHALKTADPSYADLEALIGIDPLRLNVLPSGAFQRYYDAKQSTGADLAHLKPAHINADDESIALLMGSSITRS
jgi:hypothetical protein